MSWKLEQLVEQTKTVSAHINGRWVPCRPESWGGLYGAWLRAKDAWSVMTGKADSFTWPEGQ